MIFKEKREILADYIKVNNVPILVDFIDGKDVEGAIVLEANCELKELQGTYFRDVYIGPKWYREMIETSDKTLLIINNIDTISKEEQLKFKEILKYRKVSILELPKDTVIIVTAKKKENVSEEIMSLVAYIGD